MEVCGRCKSTGNGRSTESFMTLLAGADTVSDSREMPLKCQSQLYH